MFHPNRPGSAPPLGRVRFDLNPQPPLRGILRNPLPNATNATQVAHAVERRRQLEDELRAALDMERIAINYGYAALASEWGRKVHALSFRVDEARQTEIVARSGTFFLFPLSLPSLTSSSTPFSAPRLNAPVMAPPPALFLRSVPRMPRLDNRRATLHIGSVRPRGHIIPPPPEFQMSRSHFIPRHRITHDLDRVVVTASTQGGPHAQTRRMRERLEAGARLKGGNAVVGVETWYNPVDWSLTASGRAVRVVRD